MLTVRTVYTAALLAALLLFDRCYGYPSIRQRQEARRFCEGCGEECGKCQFGVAMSAVCGVLECRKGPGQSCGGPSDALGLCGEGLTCTCNKCAGCSLDSWTCFTNPCLPHQIVDSQNLEIFNRFPLPSPK